MSRSVTAKLTSEERCHRAYAQWFMEQPPILLGAEDTFDYDSYERGARNAWQACWRYLESRVSEFIRE